MRKLLWMALFSSSAAAAATDCSWVIRLSQRTTTVVQDKSGFEAQANAFCEEYSRAKASNSSTSAGASYAGIGASFGQSGGSAENFASKLCKSDNQSSSRADAYREYVETIAPGAFASYDRCIQLTNAGVDIGIDKDNVLPTYFSASVSYRGKDSNSEQLVNFTSSPGATCKWKGGGAKEGMPFRLKVNEQTALECTRTSSTSASTIKIFPTTMPDSALDFKWTNFRDGLPADELARLRASVDSSINALDTVRASLSSSVLGFAADQCPQGWTQYEPAQGRFLRGIAPKVIDGGDPDGQRKAGAYQGDALGRHSHSSAGNIIIDAGRMNQSNVPARIGADYAFTTAIAKTTTDGGDETRPRNVAVLFCTPSPGLGQRK
ncbi:MAG TPA: hypothetical protein VF447_04240 [Terriglobales bacterium]